MKKLLKFKEKYLGHFKINVGEIDRLIRVCLGTAILIVGLITLKDLYAFISTVIGISLIITGLIGFCGIYSMLGINSCPIKNPVKKKRK